MIKIFTRTILVFLFVLITIKSAYAVSLGKDFGGRITKTTSTKIETLEDSGYTCTVPGKTVDIKSVKGPISYLINFITKSKTKTTLRTGQQILGKYTGKTEITCILEGDPPTTKTVMLDTITLFGTSK